MFRQSVSVYITITSYIHKISLQAGGWSVSWNGFSGADCRHRHCHPRHRLHVRLPRTSSCTVSSSYYYCVVCPDSEY